MRAADGENTRKSTLNGMLFEGIRRVLTGLVGGAVKMRGVWVPFTYLWRFGPARYKVHLGSLGGGFIWAYGGIK